MRDKFWLIQRGGGASKTPIRLLSSLALVMST